MVAEAILDNLETRSRYRSSPIPLYEVYGVVLSSDYPFLSPLPAASSEADLEFSCTTDPPTCVDPARLSIVDAQGERPDGTTEFVFGSSNGVTLVRVTGATDFWLWPDRIVCHLIDERHRYLVEIALFGMVLSLWLEQRGVITLHGSGAVIEGQAVGFLASRGGGKTSTAAACVAEGHPLLTDDLLALDRTPDGALARRGYPMLRLWPEQARRFIHGWERLPLVHPDFDKRRAPVGNGSFGRFSPGSAPLRRLYLPERSDDPESPIDMVPVAGQEAVMTLVAHSFLPRETQRFGLQPNRLPVLAHVAATVPVVRLRYPSGFDRLAEVVAAIAQDVRRG